MKFKVGNYITFKYDTSRVYKVTQLISDWELIINNQSKWRQDTFVSITKKEYPEYFL